MALLTTQSIDSTGVTPSFAAADENGDSYANGPTTYFHVINDNVGTVTLTFSSTVTNADPGTIATDKTLAIPTGEQRIIWLNALGFNDGNGRVSVAYDDHTDVTVGVFRTPLS